MSALPARAARALLPLLLLSAAALFAAPAAGAQTEPCIIDDFGNPCSPAADVDPPTVAISPTGGTFSAPALQVTVRWCDEFSLDGATRRVYLNGVNVTSSFSYSSGGQPGCMVSATSTGTVTLQPGANTLAAEISDGVGNPGSASASYTYVVPVPGVQVTPDGTAVTASPQTSRSTAFTVKNTGALTATFAVSPSCSGPGIASGCTATATSASLAAGASTTVSVSYTVGAPGTTGTVQLLARKSDDAQVLDLGHVDVTAGAGTALSVSVLNANPGTSIARNLCLAISGGPGAAYECGDLRIVHSLPATTTLSRDRSPTLLYNSQHANPFPSVTADVVLPSTFTATDSVVMVVKVNGAVRVSRSFPGTQFAAGGSRRMSVFFSGQSDSTGIYPYTVEATHWTGTTTHSASTQGELVIVNRSQSAFGAGWWLAGLEAIRHLPSGGKLWIGGDGSTRVYSPAGTNQWAAPSLTRPDAMSFDGTHYLRELPGGVVVRFDATGRHVSTTNRLGHVTSFGYDAQNRLGSITVPVPAGVSQSAYTFQYGTNGRLQTVVAPALVRADGTPQARTTALANSAGPVTQITGPDLYPVVFGYVAGTNLINTRTDRRGNVTAYTYFRNRISQIRRYMSGSTAAAGDIITAVTPMEVMTWSAARVSGSSYTFLNGPRTDVPDNTYFWLDLWGAPRLIQNAKGGQTVLTRGDGRFPALVTRVAGPVLADGTRSVQLSTYDGRGNVESVTEVSPYGDARSATTRFVYGTSGILRDLVHRAVGPMRDSVVTSYLANGNPLWRQDARGTVGRVTFNYGNPHGLPSSVVFPGGARDSVSYDVRGNVAAVRSPQGLVTTFHKDNLGRDTLVVSPIDSTTTSTRRQRQRTGYDIVDRVLYSETTGPAMNDALAQSVTVINAYDPEGNLESVTRHFTPANGIQLLTTQWSYDRANRTVKEIAPDGAADSTVYDMAGNVTHQLTRRGHTLEMRYDTLSQLVMRITPQVEYDSVMTGIPTFADNFYDLPAYPRYPNDGGTGYRVRADTARFAYDRAGNLTEADNAFAQVRRAYNTNGSLRQEIQRIRTLDEVPAGGNFTAHQYTVGYTYDLGGRLIEMAHPAQLAPRDAGGVLRDRTSYAYHPNGSLAKVTDPLGYEFRYAYNARGQLDTLHMPRLMRDLFQYHPDGALARHQTFDGGLEFRNTTLRYDGRGRLVRAANSLGSRDTLTVRHSGLGHVVTSRLTARAYGYAPAEIRYENTELFLADGLGSLTYKETASSIAEVGGSVFMQQVSRRGMVYDAATARLRASYHSWLGDSLVYGIRRDSTVYDAAGNVEFTFQPERPLNGDALEDRASYYAADGTLRASDYRTIAAGNAAQAPTTTVFDEYRYDALGRRVWVRSRRWCDHYADVKFEDECNVSLMRRTVWDGDRELWEIQMPGQNNSGYLENDTTPVSQGSAGGYLDVNPFFGRVGYTYGPGIDQPLSLTRVAYADRPHNKTWARWAPFTIVPLWNSRGAPDYGYFAQTGRRLTFPGDTAREVVIDWPMQREVYGARGVVRFSWHGTLTEDKQDKTLTNYRRNRYYDPATGRFTQEDPIGFAGGLNLYGFANGDPVNFSDPYGLCPIERTGRPCLSPLAGRSLRMRDRRSDPQNPRVGHFGWSRTYAGGAPKAHQGIDILAPIGAPVTAADRGTVAFAGTQAGYGNIVILSHRNDAGDIVSYTAYAHLDEIGEGIGIGAAIDGGQQIGTVGITGNASGTPPHLHFEIRKQLTPGGGQRGLDNRDDPKGQLFIGSSRGPGYPVP